MSVTINGTNGLTFNDASVQNTAATGFGFKNRIINGAMMVNQRATAITATGYVTDRWQYNGSQGGKASVAQSTAAPTGSGFINSLLVTSSSAFTYGSADYFSVQQPIEGVNCADLMWGSANAKSVTVSFWVQASITGVYGVCFINNTNNRSYATSYTIAAANTWQYVTLTVPGDMAGSWTTDNTAGIKLWFSLGAGSGFSGAAGSWSSSLILGVTGQVNLLATNGATFYITGVQLEKGSTATSFDYRPYGQELALCQRYFETNYPAGTAIGSAANGTHGASGGDFPTGSYARYRPYFIVSKRAAPTVSIWDTSGNSGKCFANGTSNVSVSLSSTTTTGYQFSTSSTLTSTEVTFAWAASAEL